MCLDPELPFVIKTTENCGIGVFPNRTIIDPTDGFLEHLYGFSFSMSCRYASQLQDCDTISDIVSITVSKNSTGLSSYYWICGPIGFVNHSCIANHCLVTVPVGNYVIGPFNDDEFKNIKKMTKHVYTCMEWQHVDNSVYSLKTVKMWDGISEFLVRYTYEGFGFQKMKCLCAYCYSVNRSKPKLAPSSVGISGSLVHDEEDTTVHAEATILITESFEAAFKHAGGIHVPTRNSEGKSMSSSNSASDNTLHARASSRSQLSRLTDLAKENASQVHRSQSSHTEVIANTTTPASGSGELDMAVHANRQPSSNHSLSDVAPKKRIVPATQELPAIQRRRLADNVPNYKKFVKLVVEFDSRGNRLYTPPPQSFGSWTK